MRSPKQLWVICTECGDRWVMTCHSEFGFIVPESESCSDCGGDIEITEEEYEPGEDKDTEREVPFDL